jgi:type IV pilus assembly protein PilO
MKDKNQKASMPWYLQLAICSVVAVLLYLVFWNFVTKPMKAETTQLNEQIAQLRQKNEAARIASQRINEVRAAYAAKMEEYDELKALLPEQREITNVLHDVQDRARSSNLVVRRFSPQDDFQKDFFSGKPVQIEVTSNFANLRDFYDQMARLQRIVSITDFKINQVPKQTASKTIDSQFTLIAYYATPENLKQGAPKPGQPGAPQQGKAPTQGVQTSPPLPGQPTGGLPR